MRVRSVTTIVVLGIVSALMVSAPASAHRGHALSTNLTGAAEVPGPGDPDGFGTSSLTFENGFRGICFQIHVAGIALPATAAHIHQGSSGVAGPVVVTLIPPDAGGNATGCVSASRDLIKTIAKHPSDYYVNVHTTDYPNGAVRGQLGKGSDHHADETDQILRARLSGPNEVPGSGRPRRQRRSGHRRDPRSERDLLHPHRWTHRATGHRGSYPPRARGRRRAGRGDAHATGWDRDIGRMHRRAFEHSPDGDPRAPRGLLRERPHHRLSERCDPRATVGQRQRAGLR